MENLAKKFDDVLLGISNNLRKHGVIKETYPSESDSEFSKLPSQQQAQIVKRCTLQLEQMELLEPSLSQEDYINTLCLFHRLKPINESMYKKLTGDTLWEILDLEFNQIYRSKLIYKLTDYSISQMEEYTPFELYDRPKKVFEQLIEAYERMRQTKDIVDMHHVKPYILKELKSRSQFMFQVQHVFNCPLVDSQTGEIKAFIAAFEAVRLDQSKMDANILLLS